MNRKIIVDIVSCLFIFLFVYAAVSKLLDIEKFRIQMGQSPILTAYANPLAWAIPVIEILISLLLITVRTRLAGLYASFGLMIMFTTYIILASRFSDYVPCSCGGVIENLNWSEHVMLNTIFIILGVTAILLDSEKEGIEILPYGRDVHSIRKV